MKIHGILKNKNTIFVTNKMKIYAEKTTVIPTIICLNLLNEYLTYQFEHCKRR